MHSCMCVGAHVCVSTQILDFFLSTFVKIIFGDWFNCSVDKDTCSVSLVIQVSSPEPM